MTQLAGLTHPLYAITDTTQFCGNRLYTVAEQLLAGGCQLLQYRDKSTDSTRRQREARTLAQLCRRYQGALIINDDLELARRCKAQGVHLGQSDCSLALARQKLGRDAIIGITCHASLSLAASAAAGGANYLAFGRFFSSQTKPDAPAAPLSLLAAARQHWPQLPRVAIGGIGLNNAQQVLHAGANYTAVCHDAFHCDDPREFATQFATFLQGEPTPEPPTVFS
jgi:thiamine-phosphate pyrophosphorylase